MIKPAIDDILALGHNRYTLVVATAKCARIVTDEYVAQNEEAERALENRDGAAKPMPSLIRRESQDEKPVIVAINRIMNGEYRIVTPDDGAAEEEQA